MTQNRSTPNNTGRRLLYQTTTTTTYYATLGVHPSASPLEIRRSYRELSKRYHPDTTALSAQIAIAKFQRLNEAYATLSNPERRAVYDQQIGYSRLNVIQAPLNLSCPVSQPRPVHSSSAYLDPTDRPLSAGEIFALFTLGLTILGCLLLAITIGLTRPEATFQVSMPQNYIQSHPSAQKPVSPNLPQSKSEPLKAPTIKTKIIQS